MIWFRRSVLALVALLASVAAIEAALPKPQLAPQAASLTGQLLVATPEMGDPRFYRTVILIVRHNQTGALGITLNRPMGERPLASLLEKLGEKDAIEGNVQIFAGGPVQLDAGFVIHTADYKRPETIDIDGEVAVTASPDILRDISRKAGPQKALVAFGYAGWGANQLETELAHKAWFTIAADLALIFDERRDRVWDEAMSRRPRDR